MDLLAFLHRCEKFTAAGREPEERLAWPGNRPMKSSIAQIAEFPLTGQSPVSGATRRAKLLATLVGLQTGPGRQFVKAVASVVELAASRGIQRAVRFSLGASEGGQCVVAEILLDADAGRTPDAIHGGAFAKPLVQWRALVDHVDVFNGARPVVHLAQALPKGAVPLTRSDVSNWAELLDAKSPTEALIGSQRQVQRIASEFSGVRQQYAELAKQVERMRSENATWNLLARVASETTNSVVIVGRDGHIEWVNHAFESLTGIAADQAVGEPFEELLFDNTDPDLATRLRQALCQRQAIIGERSHTRPDGRKYWCSFNLSPLRDEDGQLAGWVDIGSDTSAARRAREDLEQAMRTAEAANRAKSEFLANMSHEIRTPMNAILGMTELALGTQLHDQQRDFLTTVKDSAQTLLQLLNDILDLSKIEARRLELEEIDFNLADLLRETMRTLSVQAHLKGLELIWHLPLDVPQDLRGDPTRLRQVLVNLVGNAIKFTPQGEVVVSAEKQWASDGEVGLQFSVHDTGIGIPADRLEKVFEAFTQGDASTTRQFGGTGLGLTISAEILRLMHGRIRVDSTVGQGSTFFFTVRLGTTSGPVHRSSPLTADSVQGRRVLVVDDNATNRRILTGFLTHWKIDVATAENAERALAEIQAADKESRTFDLLLLDAMMPETDGFELARQIQNLKGRAPTAIMMLSSTDRAKDADRCREFGIATYLTKPVSSASLLQAILGELSDLRQHFDASVASTAQTEKGGDVIGPSGTVIPSAKQLNILIADDHRPNRQLIGEILQKRGHAFQEAESGGHVLERLRQRTFDVVLMDVQMPDMDGFETTLAIRTAERATWTHQPIVAVTAYAMKDDREKCIASGMDAYLSKPIDARELIRLVETLAEASPDSDHIQLPAAEPPSLQAGPEHLQRSTRCSAAQIDFRPALQRLAGDEDLLRRQMSFFLDEAPKLVEQLRTAIDNNDADGVKLAAHRLSGLVSSYDQRDAAATALRLEEFSCHNPPEVARELAAALAGHVEQLTVAIRDYVNRCLGAV